MRANGKLFLGGPVVDGVSLPDGVRELFASGRQQKVALIAGSNSYEATLAAVLPMAPKAQAFLKARIREIAPLYGRPANAADPALQRMFYGDLYFAAQMRALARGMGRAGGTGYLYHFAYDLEGCRARSGYVGVGHAAELLYTFDVISALPRMPAQLTMLACSVPGGPITPTAADRRMAALKHGMWVNFMRTGNPSAAGAPAWAPFAPGTEHSFHFSNSGAAAVPGLHKARLDFIEKHYADLT